MSRTTAYRGFRNRLPAPLPGRASTPGVAHHRTLNQLGHKALVASTRFFPILSREPLPELPPRVRCWTCYSVPPISTCSKPG
jgi:hypothetical protein